MLSEFNKIQLYPTQISIFLTPNKEYEKEEKGKKMLNIIKDSKKLRSTRKEGKKNSF